jgi:ATP-dependent RNA helicase RhlE
MKHMANRLAEQLDKDGLTAAAIHGNKSQGARTRALAGFKDGSVRVLVATDIAARGLDIEQLPHVVNFELPNVPEDYVHRIGRTGRAGSPGHAVSLVSPDENTFLRDIERVMKRTLPREVVAGFEAGKPGTIVEDEPRRAARTGRPQRGQSAQQKPRQPAQRKDGAHPRVAKAKTAQATPSATPKHRAAHQPSKGANGAAPKPPHRVAPPQPAPESGTNAHAPRADKRRPDRGGTRTADGVVRSNLPPGWPGSSRSR